MLTEEFFIKYNKKNNIIIIIYNKKVFFTFKINIERYYEGYLSKKSKRYCLSKKSFIYLIGLNKLANFGLVKRIIPLKYYKYK